MRNRSPNCFVIDRYRVPSEHQRRRKLERPRLVSLPKTEGVALLVVGLPTPFPPIPTDTAADEPRQLALCQAGQELGTQDLVLEVIEHRPHFCRGRPRQGESPHAARPVASPPQRHPSIVMGEPTRPRRTPMGGQRGLNLKTLRQIYRTRLVDKDVVELAVLVMPA